MSDEARGVAVDRAADRAWTPYALGERYAVELALLAESMGARKLGYSLWRIAPGKAGTPYHAHHVNEEMAWVLEGTPRLRLSGREHELRPGTAVAFPPGSESAHQFVNRSDRPALVLLASTMLARDVIDYPDTGRRLYPAGADGGRPVVVQGERARMVEDVVRDLWSVEPQEPLGPAPPLAEEGDPRIVDVEGLPWETFEGGPFRVSRRRVARSAGAGLLGYSLCRLEPGRRAWPLHAHHVNEEMFLVLEGRGTVRTPAGEEGAAPGDAIACPPGVAGAHQLAAGDQPLLYVALSTMEAPEVITHPDSDKVHVMVGAPPGGDAGRRTVDLAFRAGDAVDVLDGEA